MIFNYCSNHPNPCLDGASLHAPLVDNPFNESFHMVFLDQICERTGLNAADVDDVPGELADDQAETLCRDCPDLAALRAAGCKLCLFPLQHSLDVHPEFRCHLI